MTNKEISIERINLRYIILTDFLVSNILIGEKRAKIPSDQSSFYLCSFKNKKHLS